MCKTVQVQYIYRIVKSPADHLFFIYPKLTDVGDWA